MAGTGSVSITSTAVNHNAYDVTVSFSIAFDYGGWNDYGASYSINCDGQTSSGSAKFSISSGGGKWRWGHIATKTFRITMPTSGEGKNINVSASINTGVSPSYISTKGQHYLNARTWQWTVYYNANGGTGAPGSQTKNYGSDLVLSSTKPTRTGYTFKGWSTQSNGSVEYSPGSKYSTNKNITLYAIWSPVTYTVKFDANSGTGAPSSQTKTYGVNLTLSSTKPTRVNYEFLGWGTSAGSTTVSYSAGSTYSGNANITLYAIWKLSYKYPRMYDIKIDRCYSNGNLADDGTCMKVNFDWETDRPFESGSIEAIPISNVPGGMQGKNLTFSGTSGKANEIIQGLSIESAYSIIIKIYDSDGGASYETELPSMFYTIDIFKSGKGIAFGEASVGEQFSVNMLANFKRYASFQNNLEIKNGGLIVNNKEIYSGTDLNTLKTPGYYSSYYGNKNILNCPCKYSFRLKVTYTYHNTDYIRQMLEEATTTSRWVRQYNVTEKTWSSWIGTISDDDRNRFIKVGRITPQSMTEGKIAFNKVMNSDTAFELRDSGEIAINEGVHTVRVTAAVGCQAGSSNRARLRLKHKNQTSTYEIARDLQYGTYLVLHVNEILKVKQGDELWLELSETSGACLAGLDATFTVEKIN